MARVLLPVGPVRYNDHLHYGFWSRVFEGHDVYLYGPKAQARGRGFRYPRYEPGRPMADVAHEVQPDLFVCLGANVEWHGWKQITCPKIAVECDFHYVPSLHRYAGADVLFVRDLTFVQQAEEMPGRSALREVAWVPFSVHQPFLDAARPPPTGRRSPTVFFAGARQKEYYPVRSAALDNLQAAGLVSPQSSINGYANQTEYYSRARRHCFALACTSKWRLAVAKHVEYAAAGCAVFSDGSPGVDALLPEYQRYTPESIVEQVRGAVRDIGRRRAIMEAARRTQAHVLEHHTDEARSREIRAQLTERGLL